MPIYAYKCASCGFAKDALQKISDAPLTVCPQCGKDSFAKQVTAAGFQLKGSGWYVTDFRGGGGAAPDKDGKAESKPDQAQGGEPKAGAQPKAEAKTTEAKPAAAPSAPSSSSAD
jgi:putative FmdB family regulatory protein